MPFDDNPLVPRQVGVVERCPAGEAFAQPLPASGEIVGGQCRNSVRSNRQPKLLAEIARASLRWTARIAEDEHLLAVRNQ